MSDQEKVAAVRAVIDNWDPGSWTRGEARQDAGLRILGDEFRYEDTSLPDHIGEVYEGYEGVIRAVERWTEAYAALNLDLREIRVVGERVVSIYDAKARAEQSGIEFEGTIVYVWTLGDDGRPVHCKTFRDIDLALEEAARPI